MEIPKAILFDADGTLYDSEQIQYEATRLAAQELHGIHFEEEVFITHMREGALMGHEVLAQLGYPTEEAEYREAKMRYFQELVQADLEPMPGALDFLVWCQESGIARALVSAARNAQIELALVATGLSGMFDIVVGHEQTVGRKKPDPFPYQQALVLLEVTAEEGLAVEDTFKGVASAKAAGLRCVGIRNAANNEAVLSEAEFIFEHYDQLRRRLSQS